MQNESKKIETTANVNAVKANDEKNILDIFAKMKSKKVAEQKISSRSESIYKDKEHLKMFDGGKKWRNAKRRELLNKYAQPLLQKMNAGKVNEAKELLQKFETFYKENYTSNNFEVSSVYSGSSERPMFEYWSNFFTDVKAFKSALK